MECIILNSKTSKNIYIKIDKLEDKKIVKALVNTNKKSEY